VPPVQVRLVDRCNANKKHADYTEAKSLGQIIRMHLFRQLLESCM